MATFVVCIGSKTLLFPHGEGRTHLTTSRKKITVSPIAAREIFENAPPFVIFTVDDLQPIDATVLNMIDDCRFVNKKLVAVPWKWILHWAHCSTMDMGKVFLTKLTLGTDKKQLRPKTRKQKRVQPFEELSVYSCTSLRHESICASSRILTVDKVDRVFYDETGVIVCLRCNKTMREWSGDGYLNLVTVKPILNHMEREPSIVHLIDMILDLSTVTLDRVGFLRFGDISLKHFPADFQVSIRGLFYDPAIVLGRLILQMSTCWRFFELESTIELEILVHAALHFRIFGRVELISVHALSQHLPIETFIPPFENLKNVEIVVVSVCSPQLIVSLFRDTQRRVVSYVHVYFYEKHRLDVPGVESISFSCLQNINNSATIVVWPANTFTVSELSLVIQRPQPVILAGTPFLVPNRDLYGLFFTDLVEYYSMNEKPFTYLGPPDPIAKYLDTYPVRPIPIYHPLFCTDRAIRLYCPTYEINGIVYFDRVLLTGLLANLHYSSLKNVSILPGELIAPTLLATAVSGKYVVVSHRESTF